MLFKLRLMLKYEHFSHKFIQQNYILLISWHSKYMFSNEQMKNDSNNSFYTVSENAISKAI